MVVTHTAGAASASTSSPTASKKNRRRIVRKNPAHTFSDPSTSSLHKPLKDGEDEEMTLAPLDSDLNQKTVDQDDDDVMIDADPSSLAPIGTAPLFPPVAPGADKITMKSETRRIPIPPHRMTPLKKDWLHIFGPLTEILGLQVRMNVQRRCVEIRVNDQLCLLQWD